MSKPVLGRGLGKLLKDGNSETPSGTPAGEKSSPPDTDSETPETGRLSPGMASLLRKPAEKESPSNAEQTSAAEKPPRPSNPRLLRTSLVVADVLLLALTFHLVLKSPGRLGYFEVILCIVAIALGGWLTCLAIWRE